MIAIPVLSTSAVSVIYRSDQREPQDYVSLVLGDQHRNQAAIRSGGGALAQVVDGSSYLQTGPEPAGQPTGRGQAAVLAALLPAGDRLLEDRSEALPGALRYAGRVLSSRTVREFDYPSAGPDGPVRQVSGRAPGGPGEVVISERLA